MSVFATRLRWLAGASVLVMALAGCSAGPSGRSEVIVGAGNGVESQLLAHIYAGAIRSAGVTVDVESGLGGRADYLEALDRGEVTLVPDFTGALLNQFDSQSGATEAEDVFVDLNRSLPEGLSVGDYALAEDRTALAVSPTGPLSELSTISDFVDKRGTAKWGVVGDPPNPDPLEVGMRLAPPGTGAGFEDIAVYANAKDAVGALDSGEVEALAFTTASFGPLAADLTTLEDDENVFPAQNVVPLIRAGSLDDAAIATLSVVAGELTTADLADMIGEARGGGDSGDIAARWLGEHNL